MRRATLLFRGQVVFGFIDKARISKLDVAIGKHGCSDGQLVLRGRFSNENVGLAAHGTKVGTLEVDAIGG